MIADGSSRVVSQRICDSPADAIGGHFDVAIVGASWDVRCRAVCDTAATFSEAIIVDFHDKGSSGAAKRHQVELQGFFQSHSARPPSVLLLGKIEIDVAHRAIQELLLAAYQRADRPLEVFVDLSSVPRYISLGVLSIGAALGIVHLVTYIYPVADGYDVRQGENSEAQFSVGSWKPFALIGLGNEASAVSRSHLVVNCGYEGYKTHMLVRELEPDRVSLLIADDEVKEHLIKARASNRQLALEYLLTEDDVHVVNHLDLKETIRIVQAISQPEVGRSDIEAPEYTSFLLAGPKTLSLACAVASLDSATGALYYALTPSRNETTAKSISCYFTATVAL